MKIYRLTPERYEANQQKRRAERLAAKGTPIIPGVKPEPSASFKDHFDQVKMTVADYLEGRRSREFTLLLPCPQSVNHNSLPDGKGGRYLTAEHKTFRHEVAIAVYAAKIQTLYGILDVEILVNAPRVDIDNVVKPTLDALQRAGAIQNDRAVTCLKVVRENSIPDGTISVTVREI